MRNIGKLIRFFLLILLTVSSLSCLSSKEPPRDLLFYFFETCPSCDDYILAEEFNEKINQLNKRSEWKGSHHNLVVPENVNLLKETLKEKQLPDVSRSLPLLIIDSEYINGYEQIGLKLDELLAE
jgi:hypothetical protein